MFSTRPIPGIATLVLALATVLLGIAPASGADGAWRGWGDPCRAAEEARSAAIHDLYQRRDRAPVWMTRTGRTPAGDRLVRLLQAADADVMTDCLAQAFAGDGSGYSRGALDVMLTDAYLALGAATGEAPAPAEERVAALMPGRERQLRQALDAIAARIDREDAGPRARATGDAVVRMRRALARYRRIAERGGWPQLGPGPALEPGDSDPRVPSLRTRLATTGDLDAGTAEDGDNRYDDALVAAVKRFQRRHGLAPDGVVGPATRRALDVPARRRVARMETNLPRIEAHRIDGNGPVVRVNIPDFRVTLHERGRVTFSTGAIVGRVDRQTPVLRTRITALTLNPAWYVPRVIVREDLAQRFARDPGYAERNGFHAVNSDRPLDELDWSEPPMVAVRQAPGPANALGRIKFEMPNRQAIYLHDTPQEHLFARRRRAFSAGCVRVEEPLELAAQLTGIDRERLAEMARTGETRTLGLGWRVPVQLVYFTAWVDPAGRVQFRPDLYGRDKPRSGDTA